MSDVFDHLLQEARRVHNSCDALQNFGRFPSNPKRQELSPYLLPPTKLFEAETGLFSEAYADLRDAFVAAAPYAQWRETYKDTNIGSEFLEKFGCYCLIGEGGPFEVEDMGLFVVYMPAGLFYPFHPHPAEEIYFIIAGEAEFSLQGEGTKTLGPGDYVFHPSNAPHATQTRDHPMLALVYWRGDMSVAPVLTADEGTE